ncbi:unnamed protein product [Calypogeia fissa]
MPMGTLIGVAIGAAVTVAWRGKPRRRSECNLLLPRLFLSLALQENLGKLLAAMEPGDTEEPEDTQDLCNALVDILKKEISVARWIQDSHERDRRKTARGGLPELSPLEFGVAEVGIPDTHGVGVTKGQNFIHGYRDRIVLSADEIVKMKLEARLVVLSACQTASGGILGEGVAGLRRALLQAGVPSTVLSLWPMSDTSTRELMKDFYRLLVEGWSVAHALQSAMTAMNAAPGKKYSGKSRYNMGQWAAF